MDASAQAKFDSLLALDGVANTVSYKEYQTLMILLDAEMKDGTLHFDGKISENNQNGISQASEKDITFAYREAKDKEDIQKILEEDKQKEEELNNVKQQLSQVDLKMVKI